MVATLTLAAALLTHGVVVGVETSSCARVSLDVASFTAQLALELAPEDAPLLGAGGDGHLRVEGRCGVDERRYRLGLRASSGASTELVVDLGDVEGSLRARTLAVAAAETWRSLVAAAPRAAEAGTPRAAEVGTPPAAEAGTPPAAEAGTPRAATTEARAAPSAGVSATASVSVARLPATGPPIGAAGAGAAVPRAGGAPSAAPPTPPASDRRPPEPLAAGAPATRRDLALSVSAGARLYPAHATLLLGGRAGATLALSSWLDLAVEAALLTGVADADLGRARLTALDGSLLALAHLDAGPLRLTLGPRLTAGWAYASGDAAGGPAITGSGDTAVLALGLRGALELELSASVAIALAIDGAQVVHGLAAYAGTDVTAAIDGAELGGALTLVWRPGGLSF